MQFKDFLQLYNQITQVCFEQCVDNFNRRSLEEDEVKCVEDCASKFIKYNNKLMSNFVKTQNIIVNKKIQEAASMQELTNDQTQTQTVDEKQTSEEYTEQTRELAVSEMPG